MTDEAPQKSDYQSVRDTLSALKFVDGAIDSFGLSANSLGLAAKVATFATRIGIYAEDLIHTSTEKKERLKSVLNSSKVQSFKEDKEKYKKFLAYVEISLKEWIPDRDYPEIGYLPKELLYDKSLGDENITKYWPEAGKREQDKYIALTLNELVANYEALCEQFE